MTTPNTPDPKTASISGTVYNDPTKIGKVAPGMVGLHGRTVYIDTNNNSRLTADKPHTVTDADGNYTLSGLAAGPVIVRVFPSIGWEQTFPVVANVFGIHLTLTEGVSTGWHDFGERAIPVIVPPAPPVVIPPVVPPVIITPTAPVIVPPPATPAPILVLPMPSDAPEITVFPWSDVVGIAAQGVENQCITMMAGTYTLDHTITLSKPGMKLLAHPGVFIVRKVGMNGASVIVANAKNIEIGGMTIDTDRPMLDANGQMYKFVGPPASSDKDPWVPPAPGVSTQTYKSNIKVGMRGILVNADGVNIHDVEIRNIDTGFHFMPQVDGGQISHCNTTIELRGDPVYMGGAKNINVDTLSVADSQQEHGGIRISSESGFLSTNIVVSNSDFTSTQGKECAAVRNGGTHAAPIRFVKTSFHGAARGGQKAGQNTAVMEFDGCSFFPDPQWNSITFMSGASGSVENCIFYDPKNRPISYYAGNDVTTSNNTVVTNPGTPTRAMVVRQDWSKPQGQQFTDEQGVGTIAEQRPPLNHVPVPATV